MGPGTTPQRTVDVLFRFIAEAAAKVSGFEVAALNVVRPYGLEVVAVTESPGKTSVHVGQVAPVEFMMRWVEEGEQWGRWRYNRVDEFPPEDLEWVGLPEHGPLGPGPEDWNPQTDLLFAPLNDPTGRLIGTLSLDFPLDRKRPDPAKRAFLDLYAEQAEQALSAALDAESAADRQRQVEELTARDQYRRQLVDTMTHELRTPLTAILGHAEILAEPGLPPQESADHLGAVRRSAARLGEIINDLLDLSRVSNPHARPEISVDLGDVARTAVAQLIDVAGPRLVSLDVETPDEPALVAGDQAELALIVSNLASNAVKYSPEGGTVTVTVRADAEAVTLTCTDSGIGISAADRERVFEEFFRSADPRARAQVGTGLGLAVVQRIVVRHGGRLRVDSVLGEGSTFTVTLPQARARDSAA